MSLVQFLWRNRDKTISKIFMCSATWLRARDGASHLRVRWGERAVADNEFFEGSPCRLLERHQYDPDRVEGTYLGNLQVVPRRWRLYRDCKGRNRQALWLWHWHSDVQADQSNCKSIPPYFRRCSLIFCGLRCYQSGWLPRGWRLCHQQRRGLERGCD